MVEYSERIMAYGGSSPLSTYPQVVRLLQGHSSRNVQGASPVSPSFGKKVKSADEQVDRFFWH